MKKTYLKNVTFKKEMIAVRDVSVVKVRFHNVDPDVRLKNSHLTEFIRQEKFNSMCPVATGVIDINHETARSHSSAGQHLHVVILHRNGLLVKNLHVEHIDFKKDDLFELVSKVITEFIDDYFGDEDYVNMLLNTTQMHIYSGDIYSLELGAACYHCGDSPVQYWMR
ncbi:MAG: hypothetical protein IKA36_01455 [Clostridia bacterium]|nr:hypothetical protein [Clostridia bacterium]